MKSNKTDEQNKKQVILTEKRAFSIEEVMGASLLISIAVSALGNFTIFGFSVKNIISILMVLILGWKNGVLVGTTAGVTIGVTLGIITQNEPIIVAVYALSGMISGLLNRFGKVGVIVGFLIGNGILMYASKNTTSEFLIMASTLLYLKSKSLLPSIEEDEKEISEEELIRRIIEYKKYKEISKKLNEYYKENSKRFFKLPDKIGLPKQKIELEYSKDIIVQLYKDAIDRNSKRLNQNAKNIEKIAIVENYTVADKVKVMFKELIRKKRFIFNTLFSLNKCNKKEVVTAFTGLLELSRRNKIMTKQEKTFGDILVEKYQKNG